MLEGAGAGGVGETRNSSSGTAAFPEAARASDMHRVCFQAPGVDQLVSQLAPDRKEKHAPHPVNLKTQCPSLRRHYKNRGLLLQTLLFTQ